MKASSQSAAQSLAGRPPLNEVRLTLQPMLRIKACALEDPTCTVRGELLGLEIESGVLEITNCFSCPTIAPTTPPRTTESAMDAAAAAAQQPAAAAKEKSFEKYRTKVRELYDSVDADSQAVGPWTSKSFTEFDQLLEESSVNAANTAFYSILEDLYERCQTVDPNTILLTFDVKLHQTGKFAFKAFRIADEWFSLRYQLDRGEIDKTVFQKRTSQCSLMQPVRCVPMLTPYDMAVTTFCHPSATARLERDLAVQGVLLQRRERELTELNYALENAAVN